MKLSQIFAFVLMGFSISAQAGTVDAKKSRVEWTGSKVIGDQHHGEIQIKSGEVSFEGSEPKTAHIVVDMTSLTNKDLTDPKWNAKLVGHLKSEDFFAVEKFKTAELSIDKIQKATDKFYFLSGTLKLKDKSVPIKMKAELVKEDKGLMTIKSNFDFDRTQFGIKYGSGSFFSNLGDKMISDKVDVQVELAVKR